MSAFGRQDIHANIGLLQRIRCYVAIGDVEVRLRGDYSVNQSDSITQSLGL